MESRRHALKGRIFVFPVQISGRWIVSQLTDCNWMDRRKCIYLNGLLLEDKSYTATRKNVSDMKTIGRLISMVRDPRQANETKTILSMNRDESSDIAKQNNRAAFTFLSNSDKEVESGTATIGMESLDKFTILVLTNFIFDRVARVIHMLGFSTMGITPVIFSRCKHYTHLARLYTRKLFSCVCLQGPTRLKCLDCSISVRVILKQASISSRAMFSTQLDPPFTVPYTGHLHFLFPNVPFRLDTICCSAVWPTCRINPLSHGLRPDVTRLIRSILWGSSSGVRAQISMRHGGFLTNSERPWGIWQEPFFSW